MTEITDFHQTEVVEVSVYFIKVHYFRAHDAFITKKRSDNNMDGTDERVSDKKRKQIERTITSQTTQSRSVPLSRFSLTHVSAQSDD